MNKGSIKINQVLDTLDPELFIKYEHHMTDSLIIRAVTSLINRHGMKILDVGGASGVILNSIIQQTPYKINTDILDLFQTYKQQQVNKQINYIVGSILNNKLKDKTYDFIILRDVLHHLIGKGLLQTQKNQQRAIEEMIRLTKSGGYLIFEEEINNSITSSIILFYLSKIAHFLPLDKFNINLGRVVVSFMSQGQIESTLNQYKNQVTIVKKKFIPWHFPLLWKCTLLMSRFNRAFYILKKK